MRIGDDLYMGAAFGPNPTGDGNPAPMEAGVGPMGRVYIFDIVPTTTSATALAAAQAVAAAGNLTLTAGTGVTASTDAFGVIRYTLDVARCLSFVSTNVADTTQTITAFGYDIYGQPMSAQATLNGTTAVVTTKAFRSVTRIAVSAATAGNVSAGNTDRYGLPVRVTDVTYITSVKWASALAQDAGTFTAAVTTDPATVSTGDVRGIYIPSSAANGTRRLVMTIAMPAIAVGPQATRVGAFGVTQA